MALVAGVRWSFPGRRQGASISADMGATEDAARDEQRAPAAQTVFRRTLLAGGGYGVSWLNA
jgi:hypothetical protein